MEVDMAAGALVPLDGAETSQRTRRTGPRAHGGFLAQVVASHLREGDQRRRAHSGCARAHGVYRCPAGFTKMPAHGAGSFDRRL